MKRTSKGILGLLVAIKEVDADLGKKLELVLIKDNSPQSEDIKIKVLSSEEAEKVRNDVDIEFTCGGHHYVYPEYIPENEIWIEGTLDPLDLLATEVHEFVERIGMKYFKLQYEESHSKLANPIERMFRIITSRFSKE